MTLQNSIGDTEFPVRPRWKWRRLALANRRDSGLAKLQRRNLLQFLIPALITGAGLIVTQNLWLPLFPNPPATLYDGFLFVIIAVAALVGLVGQILGSLGDVARPVREQKRYLGMSRQPAITPAQQSTLALDAPSDFRSGLWNSSLAYHPAWVLLPAKVRARYADGEKGQPFVTLPLWPLRALREDLDRGRRILTAVDLEIHVADCFGADSWSGRLRDAFAMHPERISRLAALTGAHELDLRSLQHPRDQRPAPMLWGADAQRAIAAVRAAYGVGIVDEATAWRLIDHAAGIAAAVCTHWDEHFASLRLAVAFGSDRLQEVNEFDTSLAAYRASKWPGARASFPAAAAVASLPPAVRGHWPDPSEVPGNASG